RGDVRFDERAEHRRPRLRTARRRSRRTGHLEHLQCARGLPHPRSRTVPGRRRHQAAGARGRGHREPQPRHHRLRRRRRARPRPRVGARRRRPGVLDGRLRAASRPAAGARRRTGPRPARPGAAGIALCLLGANSQSVLFGILGCFVLFVALLIGARVFVPRLVALLARLIALITRRSPTVRLAGRSASTAGGRTASTTGALLIGITLVTAVVVGSASLQRTLELATAEDTPVDLVVTASGSDVDSVLDDSPVVDDRVEVPSAAASVSVEGGQGENDLTIASAAEAGDSSVVRSDGYDVERGTVLVDPDELGLDGVTSDVDG